MLDEDNFREAVRIYLKKIADKLKELETLTEEMPVSVSEEDTPRALEILIEEIDASEIPQLAKITYKEILSNVLKKAAYVI